MKYYTYKITNLINGKLYIGQTNDPKRRWKNHKTDSKKPKYPINFAIQKYGKENFKFEIIKEYDNLDACNLDEILLIYINDSLVETGKGYNIEFGGKNSSMSEETKKKMREVRIGKHLSEGTKKKISEAMKGRRSPMKGKYHSEKTKKKLSEIGKKQIFTEKRCKNISIGLRGRKLCKESKLKISNTLKKLYSNKENHPRYGKQLNEKTKMKLRESHLGKPSKIRKLTMNQIKQIKEEYKLGNISQLKLGIKYNVSEKTIWNIINNTTYKEVI